MGSILDVAAQQPVKGSSGPTLFRALDGCETLTDTSADGKSVEQFQLVARVGDDEPFGLVARETSSTPLVERVNARNRRRFEIDEQLKAADDILKAADVAPDTAADTDGLAPEVVNALTTRETLTVERKGLPKIDALRSRPIARMLMLYQQQREGK